MFNVFVKHISPSQSSKFLIEYFAENPDLRIFHLSTDVDHLRTCRVSAYRLFLESFLLCTLAIFGYWTALRN